MHRTVPGIFNEVLESSDPNDLYQKKLKAYNDVIEQIEQETKQPVTALEKHILPFLDTEKQFSPATVASILRAMHGSQPDLKGNVIAMFNATHASNNRMCPAFSGYFKKDENNYARFLHLGTTRIWNPDGTINEERMKAFKAFVTEGRADHIVTSQKLKDYLAHCFAKDPEVTENGNRRNANGWFFLTNKKMRASFQANAAVAGWNEVFDRLACGHDESGKPYLTWDIVEDFLRDSPKVFLMAACGLLPKVAKEVQQTAEATLQLKAM